MKQLNVILVAAVALVGIAVCTPIARSGAQPERKPAGSTLRIVDDSLVKVNDSDCINCLYAVKGSIYNPNSDGVKNVVIRYYIWKKWMGKEGNASMTVTGGLVTATIKYLPPKQTVDFMATSRNAPVMTPASGKVPDPISAEISAEWDE